MVTFAFASLALSSLSTSLDADEMQPARFLRGVISEQQQRRSRSLSTETTCKTIAGPSHLAPAGEPCVFPFTHAGTTYNSCTTAHNNGIAWCSVSSRHQIHGWGYCSPGCPGYVPKLPPKTPGTPYPGTPYPTGFPTAIPTAFPTGLPTADPTTKPTVKPTTAPTVAVTPATTLPPTPVATPAKTDSPTQSPTTMPITIMPTTIPTAMPTAISTAVPTAIPTVMPTTAIPTAVPTAMPTKIPTQQPTMATSEPTTQPTAVPTTAEPTPTPTFTPATTAPTAVPTIAVTNVPTNKPQHPCDNPATNNCASADNGGLCVKDGSDYVCQCADGFGCVSGCGNSIESNAQDLTGLIPMRRLIGAAQKTHICQPRPTLRPTSPPTWEE